MTEETDGRRAVTMPEFGDHSSEYTVRFLKQPGDAVKRDEVVLEVEADKVTCELVAPEAGTITFTCGDGVVRVGDELYALHGPAAAAAPTPSPVPSSTPAPAPEPGPKLYGLTMPWRVRHIEARAAALAGAEASRAEIEAGLLAVALARAAAATPALLERMLVRRQPPMVLVRHCELGPGEAHWHHMAFEPGATIEEALESLRPGRGGVWRMEVLRIRGPALEVGLVGGTGRGLGVIVGPVLARPAVEGEAVVVRREATLELRTDSAVEAEQLLGFAAALAEQLERV